MAKKVIIPPDKWIVTRIELIDLFDVHWNTHNSRFVAPGFPKDEVVKDYNQYDLKAYLKWMIDVHYAATNAKAMAKEKLRHEKYNADKAQYDAEERIKQLLSRDEVVSGLSLLLTGIKNKFLAWVKRLPALMANKSTRDIEPILQEELYLILSDLASGIKGMLPPEVEKKVKKKTPVKPALITKSLRGAKVVRVTKKTPAKKPGRPKGVKNKTIKKKPVNKKVVLPKKKRIKKK